MRWMSAMMLTALLPAWAEARMVVFTNGPSTVHVGDVEGRSIGFEYRSVDVFQLELWTWGGGWLRYGHGKTTESLSASEAAALLGVEPGRLPVPFSYSWPPALLIVLVAAVLAVAVLLVRRPRAVTASR